MVRLIIICIIAILALSYFGISIRHIAESPTGVDNFTYVWTHVLEGWHILLGWLSDLIGASKGAMSK
jgi:hypothetical protein